MRKVGGYLILAGLFGGWFGMMTYDMGIVKASIVTGVLVTACGLLALATYLIQE